MMRGKWTAEEDKQLREAVRRYGQKNWQQVAHCLKDRTGQQCLHRWQKTLNPDIRRGRWSPTEDMRLTLAVKAYGRSPRWVMVQKHIPGRTDVQCRERWVNIINPALNNGPWSSDELKRLEEAVKLYGVGKWALVAKAMYPRTDNQCWRRWKAICAGEEVETYRENIRKKRKGLVNNFVGREKERPALTVEDFEIEEEHREPRYRSTPTSTDVVVNTVPEPVDDSSSSGSTTANPPATQRGTRKRGRPGK